MDNEITFRVVWANQSYALSLEGRRTAGPGLFLISVGDPPGTRQWMASTLDDLIGIMELVAKAVDGRT